MDLETLTKRKNVANWVQGIHRSISSAKHFKILVDMFDIDQIGMLLSVFSYM